MCNYKTKSREGLRIHIRKMHDKESISQDSPEETKPVWYYQCNLCEYWCKFDRFMEPHTIDLHKEVSRRPRSKWGKQSTKYSLEC